MVPARQEGSEVECPLGRFMMMNAEPYNGDVLLAIHPQAAMCNPSGKYEGLVKNATYLGTISDYTVECNGVTLEIEVSCRNMHLVGETMRFDLDYTMMWPVKDEPEERIEEPVVEKKRLFSRRKQ